MKTLRDLIKENCVSSLSEENITNFFETEIKNYELFSGSELKSYFNSDKFLIDLLGCFPNYFTVAKNEGLLPFFVLRSSDDGITIVLDTLSNPD